MQEHGFFKHTAKYDAINDVVDKKIEDLYTISDFAQLLFEESENENSRFSWLSVELIVYIAAYTGKNGLLNHYQAKTAAEDFMAYC